MAGPRKPERDVDIVQRLPTRWLDPIDITRTGIQTFLAGLFGSFADKREVLAALYPMDVDAKDPEFDYSKKDEVWFDYISDTGDGWNPTYSIACLVGRTKLDVLPAKDPADKLDVSPAKDPRDSISTTRGDFTILGGDQVYPVASAEQYRDRLEGPFYCARATTNENPQDRKPVYALPGNHDWYDGLTSFIRLFCQKGRWVGQWTAKQSRSYFVIKLPYGWWIWGLDVQLESNVDPAQINYFKHYAQRKFLKEGDRVILATPEPSWIEAGRTSEQEQSQAHRNMLHLEELIIKAGATIPVRIAGDLHHYARYEAYDAESKRKSHLITCGGGGAFLHGTFGLPNKLDLTKSTKQCFTRVKVVPDEDQSEAMCGAVMWKLLWRNRWFAAAVGAVYWIYSWFLQSASEALNTLEWNTSGSTLFAYLRTDSCITWTPWPWSWPVMDLHDLYQRSPCSKVFWAWEDIVLRDPLLFVFSLVIIGGCGVFTASFRRPGNSAPLAFCLGGLHGIVHIAFALVLIKTAAYCIHKDVAVHLFVFLFGAIPGTLLVADYLWFAHKTIGAHDQEVLSTQGIEDYKCFARFHLAKNAETQKVEMTIYPVGLEKVCKKWVVAKAVAEASEPPIVNGRRYKMKVPAGTERIFEPASGHELTPRLMERPIVL